MIVEGDGVYFGFWVKYKWFDFEVVDNEVELGSDEEYEIVEEEEDEDVVESGIVL